MFVVVITLKRFKKGMLKTLARVSNLNFKIKTTMKKLELKKRTVTELSKTQMEKVKGGFTYTLSTGERCKKSKEVLDNGQTCKCGPNSFEEAYE